MERKVVLITGGAMGQGKAHALKFAQNGFDVVLADMQDPEGETFKETVAEIEATGAKALAVKCNICSDEDMQNLLQRHGRPLVVWMWSLPTPVSSTLATPGN